MVYTVHATTRYVTGRSVLGGASIQEPHTLGEQCSTVKPHPHTVRVARVAAPVKSGIIINTMNNDGVLLYLGKLAAMSGTTAAQIPPNFSECVV